MKELFYEIRLVIISKTGNKSRRKTTGEKIIMNETQKNPKKFSQALKAAFPHTIPVLTGFLVLGMAYGILMESKGYGPLWSVFMSAAAYCGSMQFVAVTLLTAAFNPVQAFLLSLTINARHLFYGLSMLEKYKGLGKVRGFLVYTLTDETFSIVSSVTPPGDVDRKLFYFSVSLLNYIYWIAGTFLGGVLGQIVTFNTKGLDFVLTALFVVLFMEQMKDKSRRPSGMLGMAASVVGLVVFKAENMVIPSMILILILLLAGRKRLCI